MSQPLQLRCNASNQDYTSYGGGARPDADNRVSCPVCEKIVKLLPKYRAYGPKVNRTPARLFIVIPSHNRAEQAEPVAVLPNIPGLEADPSAFVRWAAPNGYDMTSHPLHFLLLNEKTSAARAGWKAAVDHYKLTPPAAPVAKLEPLSEDELRAGFENWFSNQGAWPAAIERNANGPYLLAVTQSAWEAWFNAGPAIEAAHNAKMAVK